MDPNSQLPIVDLDALAIAINESRRLIDETKRLLEKSSEILVPKCTDLAQPDATEDSAA